MSLRGLVYQTVLELGECSIAEVVAKVGKHIPASTAAAACRRLRRNRGYKGTAPERTPVIEQGKTALVSERLGVLMRLKKIRRVRTGVYAPPLPQLFHSA